MDEVAAVLCLAIAQPWDKQTGACSWILKHLALGRLTSQCLPVCLHSPAPSLLHPSSSAQSWKMALQPNELCSRKHNGWHHLLEWRAMENSRWKDSPMIWFQRQCLEEWVSHVFPKRQNLQILTACLLIMPMLYQLLPAPTLCFLFRSENILPHTSPQ